jgi:hypothetical protein
MTPRAARDDEKYFFESSTVHFFFFLVNVDDSLQLNFETTGNWRSLTFCSATSKSFIFFIFRKRSVIPSLVRKFFTHSVRQPTHTCRKHTARKSASTRAVATTGSIEPGRVETAPGQHPKWRNFSDFFPKTSQKRHKTVTAFRVRENFRKVSRNYRFSSDLSHFGHKNVTFGHI